MHKLDAYAILLEGNLTEQSVESPGHGYNYALTLKLIVCLHARLDMEDTLGTYDLLLHTSMNYFTMMRDNNSRVHCTYVETILSPTLAIVEMAKNWAD